MGKITQELATEQEARDVAEAARESDWTEPSFLRELFLGRLRLDLIHPFPSENDVETENARPFMEKLRAVLETVDSDAIDRDGHIPEEVVQKFRDIGAFGIKIPREYGGLGLSQVSYIRAIGMVTSKDGSLTALLSAHQSIGLPQPLKLFGTDEQKKKFFPRLAKGAISAFALTEMDAGSDPANMRTSATLSEDGTHYILNGTKLWCTNGTRAELIVVMARTPDAIVNGKPKKQITAFIVETSWPGVEVVHRSRFMGLKAIENGVIRFNNVRVPKREHPLGRREGAQARAHHAQHRSAHASRERGVRREGDAAGRARVGKRARAVGAADRQARGDRAEDRADGGEHLRDGVDRRARERDGGPRRLRHSARGRDREAVEHGGRVAHRRRHAADPRWSRLRDRRLAARRAARRRSRSSARCATSASI